MLLDVECYPTTSEIGFIELPVAEAEATFKEQMIRTRSMLVSGRSLFSMSLRGPV